MHGKILTIFLLFAAAFSAMAQTEPANTERGLPTDGVFHAGDADAINLFNGNVTVSVPLPTYPLDDGAKFGIHLVYTGIPWDLHVPCLDRQHCSIATETPNRRSNAGLGWRVTIGSLIGPWTTGNQTCTDGCGFQYESADGALHTFFGSLHLSDTSTPGVYYTRDNTYVRLVQTTSTDTTLYPALNAFPAGTKFDLSFPDGTVHSFDASGRLVQIKTKFQSAPTVTVHYLTQAGCGGDPDATSCWQIDDFTGAPSTPREHFVTFIPDANLTGGLTANQIILGGMSSHGPQSLKYRLNYKQNAGDPQDTHVLTDSCFQVSGATPAAYDVPLLYRIDLPDGTTSSNSSSYAFTYYTDPTYCSQGSLHQMTLPTQGTVAYEYQNYLAPILVATDVPWVPGVKKRTRDGQSWVYTTSHCNPCDSSQFTQLDMTTTEYDEFKVSVARPDSATELHFFSTASHLDVYSAGWSKLEYALPLTHATNTSMWVPDGQRYLSTRTYKPDGTLAKSTFVAYEYDGTIAAGAVANNNDTRVAGASVRYDDDGSKYAYATNSNFDGVGHYRNTTIGDFGMSADGTTTVSHTTTTDFNPGFGTYISGSNGGTTHPTSTSPWVLGSYDYASSTAGGQTTRTDYCFLPNGFLLRTRARVNAGAVSGSDVVTDFTADSVTGNVVTEQYWGGDGASIDTANIVCEIQNLGTPQYEIHHEYDYGVRKKSTYYYGGSPLTGGKILDQSIDRSGMVLSDTDSLGHTTSYFYDAMLRIQEVDVPGGLTDLYTYTRASGATPASVAESQTFISGGVQQTLSHTQTADGYGRLVSETKSMPSGGTATRVAQYDVFDRKTAVSEWETSSNPTSRTTFTYDVFGRVESTTLPNNSVVTSSHTGDSTITRIAKVNASTNATTVENYDGEHHLIKVTEPVGTSTTYQYDADGHLAAVCVNGSLPSCAGGQKRTFTYDGRGFLQNELQPENGTVSYTYDSRGHVLSKSYGTLNTSDLQYSYDHAERLLSVFGRRSWDWQFRPIKSYVYDTLLSYSAPGKLVSASRENYGVGSGASQIEVTETYQYNDAAGHLTDRTTSIKDVTLSIPIKTVSQSQSYDGLGEPTSITYPWCTDNACGSANWASVTPAYSAGFLTSVTGGGSQTALATITYHPTGMVHTVVHDNGVTDTYTADGSMPRPSEISFTGWTSCAPPFVTSAPSDAQVNSGSSTTLSVSATGTALNYQWYEDSTAIAGATASSYTTPPLTTTHTYSVNINNACGTVTKFATVTVSSCTSAAIVSQTPSSTITYNSAVALSVNASGTAPLSYQWYQGTSGDTSHLIAGATSSSFTTPALTSTTAYWVKVSNSCGTVNSATILLTIPLATPTNFAANQFDTAHITVSWSAVSGAGRYLIQRRDQWSSGAYHTVVTVNAPATSYSDNVAPGAVYVYEVLAQDSAGGSASPWTAPDIANTISFSPLMMHVTLVSESHFEELLNAVNQTRYASGATTTLTWANILPAGTPVPVSHGAILARHVTSLRSAMDSARQSLQLSGGTYTTTVATGSPIRMSDVTDLRAAVQ